MTQPRARLVDPNGNPTTWRRIVAARMDEVVDEWRGPL